MPSAASNSPISFLITPQPANREALILGKIFLSYRKDLTNLALQERRLRNQRKDDLAELRELQRARVENLKASKRHRTNQLSRASQLSSDCAKKRVPFDPVTFGFDFSKEEYAHYRRCSEENYAKFGRDVDFDELMADLSRRPKGAPSRVKTGSPQSAVKDRTPVVSYPCSSVFICGH